MRPTAAELEAQLRNATDQSTRINALHELAWVLHLDDRARAKSLITQAYELCSTGEFEEKPYSLGLAGCLRTFAAMSNDAGNYDAALQESLRALDILEGIQDQDAQKSAITINVFGNLSWTYRSLADYGTAVEYAMRGLKIAQATADRQSELGMQNLLSVIYAESNDLQMALQMGLEIQQQSHERGLTRAESIALNNLALTYLDMGNGVQAVEAGQESLRIAREHGIDEVVITALSTLGEVYLGIQDYDQAKSHLLSALALSRQQETGAEELQCLMNLGKVYLFQNQEPAALDAARRALSLSQSFKDRRAEFHCHQLLSDVYEKLADYKSALLHHREFHRLKETIFNENTAQRLLGLKVLHQVETAKRDAEIHYLKTIELKREIEERKVAQQTLEKLASIDPLTGVLNRREFFLLGEYEIQRAVQAGRPITAILFDLDHFKKVNDNHGHAVGDQYLIHTSRTMRESLRQDEIIGRYGGDEFVILLPGSNEAQSLHVAERLRQKMISLPIITTRGKQVVTLSLGIVEFNRTKDDNLEALLARADQALYAAKHRGRNQAASYSQLS